MQFMDLTGQEFGRLYVFERVVTGSKATQWLCLCECGQTTVVPAGNLRTGRSTSCGCARRVQAGLASTPEYKVWHAMLSRCTDPNDANYKHYGARGIKVAPEWLEFTRFFADMGPRPFSTAQLDRERNDEGYSSNNCRWTTRKTNARNTRRNTYVTLPTGQKVTLAEASERTGINYNTLKTRLKAGQELFTLRNMKTGRALQV